MTDIREMLARALPDPMPPTAITRESAVAAGRRAARRRTRLTDLGVAAATVVVAAGASLLPMLGADMGYVGAEPSGSVSPSTVSESTSPTPPAGPTDAPRSASPPASLGPLPPEPPINRPLTEPPSQATQRLTAELKAAMGAALPDATFAPITVYFTADKQIVPPLKVIDRGGYYLAFAETRDAAGIGQFELWAGHYNGQNPKRPFATYCAVLVPIVQWCETRLGPLGERIIIEVGRPSTTSPVTEYRVDVVKPAGTALLGTVRNVSDNSGDINDGPSQRPTPPLTVDQVVDLLLTPGLTVYP